MSLIPYHSREGREIVLRHHNAIVVRDPLSQRLEIRGLAECPTCHQSLRSSSPERHFDIPPQHETYVDPDYFRMLRAGSAGPANDRPPSSPIRRLVEPALPAPVPVPVPVPVPAPASTPPRHDLDDVHDAEFVSSTPAVQQGSRIRKEAFSPNYFHTFFVEERELGRGGKGVVLLVRHEIDGCQLGHFACKRVPVGNDHAWLEKVLTEVELLARLSHPNLVSYRHVWLEDMQLTRFGPSVACAFILQQYCNSGDLLHYVVGDRPKETTKEELKARMRRRSKAQQAGRPEGLTPPQRLLPFEEIYSLFRDITSGLAYLHEANYIHRDLKPSNCLLHREGRSLLCMISDFGEVQAENVMRKSTGSTGTVSYCAPEVLREDSRGRYGNFTTKSDVFSLGMILYFMCFGRLPYRSANAVEEELEDIDELRAEITDWKGFQDERRERPDLPSKLYQLLKRLLALDPLERPSAAEVLIAMKTESNMDGFSRHGRSSSPPIARRIQSLDSPMHPGTPTPDSARHARAASTAEEDLSGTVAEKSLQQGQGENAVATQRRHSHAMTPAPSHNLLVRARRPRPRSPHRGASESPRRNSNATNGSHSSGAPSLPSPELPSYAEDPQTLLLASTPLLMPPPTTFAGELHHRAALTRYRVGGFVRGIEEQLAFAVKLVIFLVKLATLSRMCWPYSADWGVSAGLVAIAALDLRAPAAGNRDLGRRQSIQGRGAVKVDALGRSNADVRGHDPSPSAAPAVDMHAPGRIGPGRDAGPAGSRRGWGYECGWQRSCMLLILHFVILWAMSRSGTLCAGTEGHWADA